MSLLTREDIGKEKEIVGKVTESEDKQITGKVLYQCKNCSKVYDNKPRWPCKYNADGVECGSIDFKKRLAKGTSNDRRIITVAVEGEGPIKVILLGELAIGFAFKIGTKVKVTGLVEYEEVADKVGDSFIPCIRATKIEEQREPPIELTEDLTKEVTFADIERILSTTIKKDGETKVMVFNGMLLAQTNNDQLNITMQADSSSGKSYIPLEDSAYFPEEEVVIVAGASPTSFFHERGEYDEEKKLTRVDLEGKILVFTDQPHFLLLQKLRSFLAHDRKELVYKITDKSKSGSNRTKTILLKGYATVIFCTASFESDEQEQTRTIFLSPSGDEDKIKQSLLLLTKSMSDGQKFRAELEANPDRKWLRDRIKAVRQSGVREIVIPDAEALVFKRFWATREHPVPRHQRDYKRLFATIKAHALLNCFKRERIGADTIVATKEDIDAGFKLYDKIAESNELGLSPHMLRVYKEVISPLFRLHKDDGKCTKKEITQRYFKVFHKYLPPKRLDEILGQLEVAGLVEKTQDPDDKRITNYIPPDGGYLDNTSDYTDQKIPPIEGNVSQSQKVTCDSCGKILSTEADYQAHWFSQHVEEESE